MRRVVFCFALAAVIFCGAFAPLHTVAQSSKQLSLYTDALKRYLIHNDTTTALNLVNQALAEDSTYMPALNLLSRLERDPQKAWRAAEAALAADTTNSHLQQQAAELSLRAQQYDRAKQLLTTLTKESQNLDHFRLLALLHNMSKDRKQAVAALDSAEVRFGKIDVFNHLRQQIYLDGGELDKALKCALDGVESAPYDPANHIALAEVYAASGVDSLADVSFNKAIALDKTNPAVWFEYARFLDNRSRHTEMLLVWRNIIDFEQVNIQTKLSIVESITSKRDFYRKNFLLIEPIVERMYQLYPDNARVVDSYISHLIAGNRVEEALVMLKGQIKGIKPSLEQLDRIIEIEYYINRTDSVEVYIDKGIELYPTHDSFWSLKSWLQTKRGDHKGAINTLKSALTYAENSVARSSLWGGIGDKYYEMGQMRKSYGAYNKALLLNFDNAVVLNNYAYHLSVMEQSLKEALRMAKKATELSPNNATYLDTLAWVYYKLGEYDQAKKVMQQAMSFDKEKSSELALHYGDILDALGSTFMAQTYWRKALERGAAAEVIEQRLEAQQLRLKEEKGGQK